MIHGIVNADLDAILHLVVRGPAGQRQRVKAVIDTGFSNWLSLPPAQIALLGLPWQQRGRAILADGSDTPFDIFEGTVIWDRRRIRIPIYELDSEPLVGMALLEGYELKVQVRHRGSVIIQALP